MIRTPLVVARRIHSCVGARGIYVRRRWRRHAREEMKNGVGGQPATSEARRPSSFVSDTGRTPDGGQTRTHTAHTPPQTSRHQRFSTHSAHSKHISADLVRSEPGRRRTRKEPCRGKEMLFQDLASPCSPLPLPVVASLQSPYPVRTRGGGGVPDLGFPQMEEGKAGGWAGAGGRGVLLTVGAPNGRRRLYVVRCRLLVLVAGARTGDVVWWRVGRLVRPVGGGDDVVGACLQGQSTLVGVFLVQAGCPSVGREDEAVDTGKISCQISLSPFGFSRAGPLFRRSISRFLPAGRGGSIGQCAVRLLCVGRSRGGTGEEAKKKDSRRCDVLGILSDTATGVGWCWWRLWSAEPMLAATVPYNGQARSRTAAMRVVGFRTCGGETMSQPMGNGAHDSRQPSAKCQS